MRFVLPPPRHSQSLLTRIVASVAALVCLGALVVFGTLALAILVVAGLVGLVWFRWRLYKLRKHAASQPGASGQTSREHADVIEGEYTVVNEHRDNVHQNRQS